MISVTGWILLLISYSIFTYTTLSFTGVMPSPFQQYPTSHGRLNIDEFKDQSELFNRLDNLNLSGEGLVSYFEERAKVTGDKQMCYNLFNKYLFSSLFKRDTACDPDSSIVAKLTKNIQPNNIHSHNDYWKTLPLFEGLAFGSRSTEADVWLVEDLSASMQLQDSEELDLSSYSLAVGHKKNDLDVKNKNLETLYTGPLLKMLNNINCDTSQGKMKGVFLESPDTTLYLYIDFKPGNSEIIYRLLMEKYLQPLIEAGYVSYYDALEGNHVVKPITVILTGDYPTDMKVLDGGENQIGYFKNHKRYVFPEAQLDDLDSIDTSYSLATSTSYKKLLSICGSSSLKIAFKGHLDQHETTCIKKFIEEAHSRNLKTRIWGIPEWPEFIAKTLWRQQMKDLDVDFLNVDHLNSAAFMR